MKTESTPSSMQKVAGSQLAETKLQSPLELPPGESSNPPSQASTHRPKQARQSVEFELALFFGIPFVGLFLPLPYSIYPKLAIPTACCAALLFFLWLGAIYSMLDTLASNSVGWKIFKSLLGAIFAIIVLLGELSN